MDQHSHLQSNAPRAYRSKSRMQAVDKYKSKTVPNTWHHSLYNPKSNSRIHRSGAIKSISPSVSGRCRATPASEKVLVDSEDPEDMGSSELQSPDLVQVL